MVFYCIWLPYLHNNYYNRYEKMEASLSQKDKIAAAKKKLKRFQQKSARLEKVCY